MSSVANERILLVDDEEAILEALCRQHYRHFSLVSAGSPMEGLRLLENEGPFAVVVSDYQMPGMNGAAFLEKSREICPEIIRILLTGNADLGTAIDAVNRGHIFRFLSKPCEPDLFRRVLGDAIEQYRLGQAERILLEETVKGCVEVLSDVLGLANPTAFGRASRVRQYVRQIVAHLGLESPWQYETAALLSQIGCIAIPDDVFVRLGAGDELRPEEMVMLDQHPELARDLLRKIPRFEGVAEMIRYQRDPKGWAQLEDSELRLGVSILAVALSFEELVSVGSPPTEALRALSSDGEGHDARVVAALASAQVQGHGVTLGVVTSEDLEVGMVLEEEIRTKDNNLLIVPRGHELSASSLQRLKNYSDLDRLHKGVWQVRVSVPGSPTGDGAPAMA